MKKIYGILREYLYSRIPPKAILLSFLLAATAVFFEYRYDLRSELLPYREFGLFRLLRNMAFYGTPLILFLLFARLYRIPVKWKPVLWLLLLTALLAFAMRAEFTAHFNWFSGIAENQRFTRRLANSVFLGPILCLLPVLYWFVVDRRDGERFYGCSLRQFSAKPYWLLLLGMVPLITLASTQADFLGYYPKGMRMFDERFPPQWSQVLLYEGFYGLDFVYIEFFFRGFLVIAFSRFLGPVSIPFAALMYCTIHFGKPLGETISSWFGGMILGILVLETRSILGGIMVHMGIAWLMELGGWIGNSLMER